MLTSTEHGAMILNRFDYHNAPEGTYGVGHVLLENAVYEPIEIGNAVRFLNARRAHRGDGVVALDCGANIGVHTVEWARAMSGWGRVIAIEAQERIYYALAGNVALNNCFNARAIHAAVAAECGTMRIPTPDYLSPGSFGSLELRQSETTEFIGQPVGYGTEQLTEIRTITVDSLDLDRLDLIKIDVEGMELDVLRGAHATIARHKPIVVVERLKTRHDLLIAALTEHGYTLFFRHMNILAIHPDDAVLALIPVARP